MTRRTRHVAAATLLATSLVAFFAHAGGYEAGVYWEGIEGTAVVTGDENYSLARIENAYARSANDFVPGAASTGRVAYARCDYYLANAAAPREFFGQMIPPGGSAVRVSAASQGVGEVLSGGEGPVVTAQNGCSTTTADVRQYYGNNTSNEPVYEYSTAALSCCLRYPICGIPEPSPTFPDVFPAFGFGFALPQIPGPIPLEPILEVEADASWEDQTGNSLDSCSHRGTGQVKVTAGVRTWARAAGTGVYDEITGEVDLQATATRRTSTTCSGESYMFSCDTANSCLRTDMDQGLAVEFEKGVQVSLGGLSAGVAASLRVSVDQDFRAVSRSGSYDPDSCSELSEETTEITFLAEGDGWIEASLGKAFGVNVGLDYRIDLRVALCSGFGFADAEGEEPEAPYASAGFQFTPLEGAGNTRIFVGAAAFKLPADPIYHHTGRPLECLQ